MSCRLDYCNSLLAGVADVHLRRLQLVQNDAACLVCGARPHDHITPILATLHWLPVCQRVIFKPAVLVWKCLHDAAPRYLSELCVPAASTDGRRQSRCAVFGAPWCPGLGCLLASAALLPLAPGPGTDCQRPSDHQNCRSFFQAPAQDPPVPALDSAGCSSGCRVPSSDAVVTVQRVRRQDANYKCPDSTQLSHSPLSCQRSTASAVYYYRSTTTTRPKTGSRPYTTNRNAARIRLSHGYR